MFENIKKQKKELAKNAVLKAEQELGSGKGQQKKRVAIDYVLKNLPIPEFMKMIVSVILSSFIDDSIELAVSYINSLSKMQGE